MKSSSFPYVSSALSAFRRFLDDSLPCGDCLPLVFDCCIPRASARSAVELLLDRRLLTSGASSALLVRDLRTLEDADRDADAPFPDSLSRGDCPRCSGRSGRRGLFGADDSGFFFTSASGPGSRISASIGTSTTAWHFGHRIRLPAAYRGTPSVAEQP